MLYAVRNKSLVGAVVSTGDVIFHTAIRNIRKNGGHPIIGLFVQMGESVLMMLMFYLFYMLFGREVPVRGDLFVFLTTGIFLFLLHNKAMGAVLSSGSTTSKMNLHAPINFIVDIAAASLSLLYLQILAFALVAFGCKVLRGSFPIEDPGRLVAPFILAWASGLAFGFLFLSIKPLAPKIVDLLAMIHRRANMFTSAKMIPANLMATYGLIPMSYMAWNPLFHVIDNARGAAFLNYYPRYSNLEYPFYFSLFGIGVGIIAIRWQDRNLSASSETRG